MVEKYTFIVPVYNRPEEVDELLQSLSVMHRLPETPFEVVLVEDGSTQKSDTVADRYRDRLEIQYFYKPNSGPGDSRNYGMRKAVGDYFIILDSDCILPPHYLQAVHSFLSNRPVDCFGGPDAAHSGFSALQKAINYVMTSFLTTGGIRGKRHGLQKFEPRSFNMGLSREAFEATQGFGNIHPGEDPDLTHRLWKAGFETAFVENAFVYHKRRISWSKFYKQVRKFGLARPILSAWHKRSNKTVFWLPTLFVAYNIVAIAALLMGYWQLAALTAFYCLLVFADSWMQNKSVRIAFYTLGALFVQFFGYGLAFFKSTVLVGWMKKDPKKALPEMFF